MAASRPSSTDSSPSTAGAATFAELGVPARLCESLAADGITHPFPIQAATLVDSLAGRDVLGRGRTGSGKTLAFLLPVLTRLAASSKPREPRRPRALILAPTRELASQINAAAEPLAAALGLRTTTVFGGVGANPQISALRSGIDLLIACPGRLADHLGSGHADLSRVEITVLDEADHMADLGFLPVVRRLLDQTPAGTQRMLFSATLDAGVDVIVKRYLNNAVTHSVDSVRSPVTAMDHHVLHVTAGDRLPVLVDLAAAPGRTMVFTRTKHGAKKLTRQLVAAGVPAVELHGNLAQNARTRNLAAFSDGTATTLVATDIAARGIHVDDVALVVHADPPIEHKAYLHRSGRTARAGAAGTVVTLMTDDQVADVRDLTRKAGIAPTTTRLSLGHPLLATLAPGERTFTYPTPAEAAAAKAAIASGAAEKQRQGRPGGGARGGSKAGHRSSAKAGAKNGTKSGAASATNSGARSGGQRGGRSGAARAAVSPSARSGGAAAFSARGGGRRRSA
jgi:superfamily II DNA/RNA helicase